MTIWHIKPLTGNDIETVLRLWVASDGLGRGPGDSVDAVNRFLRRNPDLSLVAVEEGVIVAAVLCGQDGRRGFIYRLAVADSHRRQGIAMALVRRCLSGLEAEGIPRCLVFVLVGNEAAVQFWQAMGAELQHELQILALPV